MRLSSSRGPESTQLLISGRPSWIRHALPVAAFGLVSVPFAVLRYFPSRDFSSHVYNAWLAVLVERGDLPGLYLQPTLSNLTFDLILSWLLALFSPHGAAVVGLTLLGQGLLWSSFWFLAQVCDTPPWECLPVLAAVSVGWTFHMGFANFILSLSLCLVAIPLITRHRYSQRKPRLVVGFSVLFLALFAHPLPVTWAIVAILALALPFRTTHNWNPKVLLALLVTIPLLATAARALLRAPWSTRSLLFATGADQLAVFDSKYAVFSSLLLISWASSVAVAVSQRGFQALSRQPITRIVVTAVAVVTSLPTTLRLPGSDTPLGFLAPRSSVIVAICAIGIASLGGYSFWRTISNLTIAVLWFSTIAFDWHSYSQVLTRVEASATVLPADARVMGALSQPASRIDWLSHVVDHFCVGRCLSFANYEPSTKVFRIRATSGNEFVLSSADDLHAAESGHFRIPDHPTIYVLRLAEDVRREPTLSIASPGVVVERQCVDLLWQVPRFGYDRCRFGPPARY